MVFRRTINFFLAASVLLLPGHLLAQQSKGALLLEAATAYLEEENDTIPFLIQEAIRLFESNGETDSLGRAYELLQEYYYRAPSDRHSYVVKDSIYQEIAHFFSTVKDSARLGRLYMRWTDIDQEVDYQLGQEHIIEADRLFRAINDTLGMADAQFRMGVLQGSMGNQGHILQHFEAALALSRAVRDTAYIAESLTRLGEFYMRKQQWDEAETYIQEVLDDRDKARPSTMINAYRIKGYIAAAKQRFEEAFQNLQLAIGLAGQEHDEVRTAMLYLDMGQIHFSYTQDFDEALFWLQKGLIAAEESRSQRFSKSAHLGLATIYEARQDYASALYHQKKFSELQQEMQSNSARQRMLLLEAQYENEKKEAALARQQALAAQQKARQRGLLAVVAALGLVVLGITIAYYLEYRTSRQLVRQKAIIEEQAEELRQLDEAKSRFFANISHELRTPLTLMLGPIHSLIQRSEEKDEKRPFLLLAQESGQRLLRRINEILALSRLESGKLEVQSQPLAAEQFLRRQAGMFESHAQQQQIRFEYQSNLDPNLYFFADEDKLEKIIHNLLSNALKYTNAGGTITMKAQLEGRRLEVSIMDTGRGIHPDDLTRIFERFYQSRRPGAPLEGGAGIGLALARELAELLGGALSVESQWGKGSTFLLELPWEPAPAMLDAEEGLPPEAVAEQAITPATQAGGQAAILLAEDNSSLREYLSMILQPRYRAIAVKNGREALEYLKNEEQERISLVISDVMMPEMDGFRLLKAIKDDEHLCHLPVILLTARAEQADKIRALRIGVDDYLLKPFQEEELLLRVQNLLKNYQQRLVEERENPGEEAVHEDIPSKEAQQWLGQLERITGEHLSDIHFSTDTMADAMAISRRQLFRRVKKLTGLTPNAYIQEARYRRARLLLENQSFPSVKAIAYEVGMKDVRYFSQQFRSRFGKLPSAYF